MPAPDSPMPEPTDFPAAEARLRHWAAQLPLHRLAIDVRLVLAELEQVRAELAACRRRCENLADRVAVQSDQLSRAERAVPR